MSTKNDQDIKQQRTPAVASSELLEQHWRKPKGPSRKMKFNESRPRLHLDLFSGIGGFALAAEWAGFKTIGFSEIDPYASAVLKKHWPHVVNYGDIRNVPAVHCNLLTGGFPCQPFSLAGKRKGKTDDRYLWSAMLDVIERCQPSWVLGENVPGILSLEFGEMLADLESKNYQSKVLIIPACATGAQHIRSRVWIVANADESGRRQARSDGWVCSEVAAKAESGMHESHGGDATGIPERCFASLSESNNYGIIHGIPSRLDSCRIAALGNAIVPQVAFEILRHIRTLI